MLKVNGIPAFTDNYIWAIQPNKSNDVYVVDPGDADAVIRFLKQHHLELKGILITHHHQDHTGGILELQQYCGNTLVVYGPNNKAIDGITVALAGNQDINIEGFSTSCCVIPVPGHTLDHIAYLIDGHLFCGDTLFSGGCGRLFEGTAKQMLTSLHRLADLPANTKVYCAHEYTQSNLKFAVTADPANPKLLEYQAWVNKARANQLATIPTELATEQAINPFLRCHTNNIKQQIEQHFKKEDLSELETFTLLRQWKDNF